MPRPTTWIALLRGINVGGHNKLPMADLVSILSMDRIERLRTPRETISLGNRVLYLPRLPYKKKTPPKRGSPIDPPKRFNLRILRPSV